MGKRDPELIAARQLAANLQAALTGAGVRFHELEALAAAVNARLSLMTEERDAFRAACRQLESKLASAHDPEG